MIYSLLEPLVIVTCCVFKYFRFILKVEKVHSPAGNFFKRRVEKTYLIWNVGGGVLKALTKKIYPSLF